MKIKVPDIYIKEIPIKGRGVFAGRTYAKGDLIEIAPVIKLTEGQAAIAGTTKLAQYLFSGIYECELVALGYASLYNHDFKPNADWTNNNEVLVIVASKPIKKDEEITISYGWDNDSYKMVGIPIPKKRKAKRGKK